MNRIQRCVDKDVAEKRAYQFRPHSTRRTWPNKEGIAQRCPRNTQDSGKTLSQAHGKFCGHSKPGLLVPCALRVWSRERYTGTEESLYEAMNSGRVDVEGKTGEKERSCGTTFAKLFDEEKAVDLIGAEDDVV